MNTFTFLYPIAQLRDKKFKHAFNLVVLCAVQRGDITVISIKLQGGQDELLPVIDLLSTELPCIQHAAENNFENQQIKHSDN